MKQTAKKPLDLSRLTDIHLPPITGVITPSRNSGRSLLSDNDKNLHSWVGSLIDPKENINENILFSLSISLVVLGIIYKSKKFY